jgi:hypothetical protein
MPKPPAYSPVHRIALNTSLSRRRLSIIAVVGAIMVLMIGFALVNAQEAIPPCTCHYRSERHT